MIPRPTPNRRRPPARQLLLSAAARVFARDGLEGATTRAISREAGVNEVTLFRNFGTKEHLLEEVVGRAFGARRASPATGGSLRADLCAFARDYEALLAENLHLIRSVIGEIHRHSICEHQALQGIFTPMRAALVRRLELAVRLGEARPGVNPPLVADFLAGAIFTAVLRRAASRASRGYRASLFRESSVDILLCGIGAK